MQRQKIRKTKTSLYKNILRSGLKERSKVALDTDMVESIQMGLTIVTSSVVERKSLCCKWNAAAQCTNLKSVDRDKDGMGGESKNKKIKAKTKWSCDVRR